jgi:hypothetical protein
MTSDGVGSTQSPNGPTTLTEAVTALFNSLRALGSDATQLVVLEARRAGVSLGLMVACGALSALLLATSWLSLVAGAVAWALTHGVRLWLALACAALANLALSAVALLILRRVSRHLLFEASRRQLVRRR